MAYSSWSQKWEPSWHRRERQNRSNARTASRLSQWHDQLEQHHGSTPNKQMSRWGWKQPFETCKGCGRWEYTDKLEHNGRKCAHCSADFPPPQDKNNTNQELINELLKAGGEAIPEELRKKVTEAATTPQEPQQRTASKGELLTQAAKKHQRLEKEYEQATKHVLIMNEKARKAESRADALAQELLEAEATVDSLQTNRGSPNKLLQQLAELDLEQSELDAYDLDWAVEGEEEIKGDEAKQAAQEATKNFIQKCQLEVKNFQQKYQEHVAWAKKQGDEIKANAAKKRKTEEAGSKVEEKKEEKAAGSAEAPQKSEEDEKGELKKAMNKGLAQAKAKKVKPATDNKEGGK